MSTEQVNLDVTGGQDAVVPDHLNFGKYLFENIRKGGTEVAIHNVTTNEKYTYEEIIQKAVDLSIGFSKLGMGKGDVALVVMDTILFVPTALAVICTGATLSSMFLTIGTDPLKKILKNVPPAFIICSGRFWKKNGDILQDVKPKAIIISDGDGPQSAIYMTNLLECHNDVNEFVPAEVDGQKDVAVIYYSSGTTGIPKAVQLTHFNCLYHSIADDFMSFKVGFFCRPWGLNYYDFKTYMFLASGKKMVHSDICSVEILLQTVEKCKIDIVFCSTVLVYELANSNCLENYNLFSLKVIHSRSAPLRVEVIDKIYKRFPPQVNVVHAYGMTECGELASGIRVLNGPKGLKHGSVGIPTRGITLKVIDPQTGERLPANTHGELCVKGAGFMKGYVGLDLSKYLDAEGFFKTSDLGYFDDDGYFYVIDRLKDIMIYNCHNVAPSVLENLLLLHPGVKDAGVVSKPHPALGDLPTAFVVKRPGSDVTEQDLVDYISKEMGADIQLKGGAYFISKIPRNERGKILRRQLKEMLDQV